MSATSKQTDKTQEDSKSICGDTEKIKHSKDYILVATLDRACLHLIKTVPKTGTKPSAYLLL